MIRSSLSIDPSIYLSIYLSIHLSIYPLTCCSRRLIITCCGDLVVKLLCVCICTPLYVYVCNRYVPAYMHLLENRSEGFGISYTLMNLGVIFGIWNEYKINSEGVLEAIAYSNEILKVFAPILKRESRFMLVLDRFGGQIGPLRLICA